MCPLFHLQFAYVNNFINWSAVNTSIPNIRWQYTFSAPSLGPSVLQTRLLTSHLYARLYFARCTESHPLVSSSGCVEPLFRIPMFLGALRYVWDSRRLT